MSLLVQHAYTCSLTRASSAVMKGIKWVAATTNSKAIELMSEFMKHKFVIETDLFVILIFLEPARRSAV